MANISSIKLPNGTTYNLKDNDALEKSFTALDSSSNSTTGTVQWISNPAGVALQLEIDKGDNIGGRITASYDGLWLIGPGSEGYRMIINDSNITFTGGSHTIYIPKVDGTLVAGTGTSGYLTKWNGTNTLTKGPQIGSSTTTYLRNDGSWATPTNTNTTYTLTNALASHKYTWTFTAGGSGSGSTTTVAEFVQGTGITLTDDTTNKKITIANAGVTGVKGDSESSYRTGQVNLTAANIGAATSGHTHTTSIATSTGTSSLTLAHGGKYSITAGGTSYIFTMPSVASSTGSATTGITIAAHGTGTVIGVQSSTTTASKVTVGSHSTDYGVKSAGSASTWTFESKSIPNVTAVGSGSASLTFAMDTTDTKKLKITFSHTHTAPTLGTAITVQSKSGGANGTAPTLGSKIPTVGASDVTVPIKNSSASTFVTGTTHTITDNGHTHTI